MCTVSLPLRCEERSEAWLYSQKRKEECWFVRGNVDVQMTKMVFYFAQARQLVENQGSTGHKGVTGVKLAAVGSQTTEDALP